MSDNTTDTQRRNANLSEPAQTTRQRAECLRCGEVSPAGEQPPVLGCPETADAADPAHHWSTGEAGTVLIADGGEVTTGETPGTDNLTCTHCETVEAVITTQNGPTCEECADESTLRILAGMKVSTRTTVRQLQRGG